MKFLVALVNFLQKAFSKEYIGLTMGIIIALLVIMNIRSCNRIGEEKEKAALEQRMHEQNMKAFNDTIRTYYDKKLGQMVADKNAYLVKTVDDLKQYNQSLYDQLKGVKNLIAGVQSTLDIRIPPGTSFGGGISQVDTNTFKIKWHFPYQDSGLVHNLAGFTQFKVKDNNPYADQSRTEINDFRVKVTYAFQEDDKGYKVWATSPSPLIKFEELNGALMLNKVVCPPAKTSPWSIGPSFQWGLNTNMIGTEARFGWSVGLAVTYNIVPKPKWKWWPW